MFCLRSLSLNDRNHLMRPLNLQWREMMLDFNLFQALLSYGDTFAELSLFIDLDSLPLQLLGDRFNFTLQCASLFVNLTNCSNQPLTGSFFQVQSTNLLCDLESCTSQLATVTQEFPGTLSTRHSVLCRKLFKLL